MLFLCFLAVFELLSDSLTAIFEPHQCPSHQSILLIQGPIHAILWFPPSFLAVNHHNIKNWVPSILTHNLWLIFMGLRRTTWRPYRLSHIDALRINQSYYPKDQSVKFWQKLLSFWRCWKTQFFFESAILIVFFQKKKYFCFIPMKIGHKLCVRMDGTQFLILWWFTAKNEGGNHKISWVYRGSPHFVISQFVIPAISWFCFSWFWRKNLKTKLEKSKFKSILLIQPFLTFLWHSFWHFRLRQHCSTVILYVVNK